MGVAGGGLSVLHRAVRLTFAPQHDRHFVRRGADAECGQPESDRVLALPGAEPSGGPGVRAVYHHRGRRRGGGGPGDDYRDLSLASDGECG